MPLLPLLALTVLFAGGSAPPDVPLQGTTWVLTEISPTGGELLTPGKLLPRPTLRLEQTRLEGQTGCHALGGQVRARAGQWKAQPRLGPPQDCTDHALSLEADYLRLLSEADHYQLQGPCLSLWVQGRVRLMFMAQGGPSVRPGCRSKTI